MFLFDHPLHDSSLISHSCIGNFLGLKSQELLIAYHTRLALYRIDSDSNILDLICSADTFGIVGTLIPFRLIGTQKGISSPTTYYYFGEDRLYYYYWR